MFKAFIVTCILAVFTLGSIAGYYACKADYVYKLQEEIKMMKQDHIPRWECNR